MQDRAAIARTRRRELARETLELELARADELQAELEELRSELDGREVDAEAFAAMNTDDVELVREAMGTRADDDDDDDDDDVDLGLEEEEWDEGEIEIDGDEDAESSAGDYQTALAREIEQLELELADSARTQRALQRYLDVLGA